VATSLGRVRGSGIRRSKHWVANTLRSVSAISNQRPGFGVSWISRRASKRRASVGAKASYKDAGVWVLRWSMTSTMFSACGYGSSTNSRITWAKSIAVRRSVTLTRRCPAHGSNPMHRWAVPVRLFIIDARGLPRGCGEGLPGGCHELLAGLIQADLRASGIVGTCVDLQHILHGPDTLGVGLRGDPPRLLVPRFEGVLLRVARTHSARMVSTLSRSTSVSANHVRVHRTRPSGGALQATAISWASWTPSSWRYCRPVGRLRDTAASMPASTQAWRTRWTVAALVSKASAISASGQR
jgi:hypothetical protein